MRVQITLTVDIDTAAWSAAYGVEGARDIRTDVKSAVQAAIFDHLHTLGMLAPASGRYALDLGDAS